MVQNKSIDSTSDAFNGQIILLVFHNQSKQNVYTLVDKNNKYSEFPRLPRQRKTILTKQKENIT